MPRIILHIGLEKTGTTSIQHFLSANRQRLLAEHGILYPTHPALYHAEVRAHSPLTAALLPPASCDFLSQGARPEVTDVIDALGEALATRPEILLLSSEHLSSRLSPAGVAQLAKLLCLFRVEILVYLRRQDDMGVAAFSTGLKCGRRDWLIPREISPKNPYYDFVGKLEPWGRIFGRDAMTVRLFDQAELLNGDVVDDFLATIGVHDIDGYERDTPLNTSLTVAEAALLHMLNQCVPTWDEAAQQGRPTDYHRAHQLRLKILDEVRNIPAMRDAPALSSLLTAWDRARIRQRFKQSNACLARDYLGRAQLFEEDRGRRGKQGRIVVRPKAELPERQFAEILLMMAERLQEPGQAPLGRGFGHGLSAFFKRRLRRSAAYST